MIKKVLKIAQVAPLEESVPPIKYGGTELVISNLTEELVHRGHHVTLLAAGDSKTRATLLPVFKKSIRQEPDGQDLDKRNALKFIGVARVVDYLQKNHFDIIHNHLGWRLLPFSDSLPAPIVTTLHGPLDIGYQRFVYGQYPAAAYVTISKSQRRAMPHLNFVGTVYNGIDVAAFDFSAKPGKYLAFLGRMSPEKGPIEAIRAAKKARLPLIMAAKIDIVDKPYFARQVKPLIDGKQIKFIGEVNHQGKVKLLKNALALLALIQWEEPFGLFMVEALACGTPVIATRRGSVPEIIQAGKTGFIVKDYREAASTIKKIGQINRRICRLTAEKRFTTEIMADGY